MIERTGTLRPPAPSSLGEDDIRRAAAETLRQWPGAEAAILFGSRARGDHRPDSDWDIAIVTSGDGQDPEDVALRRLGGRYEVDILPLTRGRLQSKCNAPGHVGFDIARQGRLLAGRWQPPALEDNALMQPEEFRKWYDGARSKLDISVTRLVAVARCGSIADLRSFVAATADAAEYLVKGMICRHTGLSPSRSQAVDVLADELPEPLRREAAALNGKTKKQPVEPYEAAPPSDCRHAGACAILTLKLLIKELVDAHGDPGLAAVAEKVARILLHQVREWQEALRVPADEEAIRDMIDLEDDEIMLAAAIAQREPLAAACAAAAELERMPGIRAKGP